MFFNTEKTKRKEVTLQQLKDLVKALLPNHIREYGNGTKEHPLPGTYWAISSHGMVWYDPDCHRKTFDEALYELVNPRYGANRPERKHDSEIENQKLKLRIEELKLELIQVKAAQAT